MENFAEWNSCSIFAVPKRRFRRHNAEIAQLVERNLAKVEVAGPSPVFRSNIKGRTGQVLPLMLVVEQVRTCPRDLKTPLPGAGGVDNGSRPLARSASASPVFRSREAKERRIARFSFLFFGGGGIRCPRPQDAPSRGRGCRQRIAAARARRGCGPISRFIKRALPVMWGTSFSFALLKCGPENPRHRTGPRF